MRCTFCAEPVVGGDYVRRVVGWERKRSQGGANQITLREIIPGVVAHEHCIRREVNRLSAGISEAQPSML